MEVKAANPSLLLEGIQTNPIMRAYFEFNHLKQLYRQGWLRRGIAHQQCESVAEHCFGTAILALFLAEVHFPELDSFKVVRMSLLHDFGEIYAGDFIPSDGIEAAEKNRLERQSVENVLSRLPNGQAYIDTWNEFEEGRSPEARFVRQIDRLEMALQASVYEYQGQIDLQEFFDTTRQALSDPALQELLAAINTNRYQQPVPGRDSQE